MSTIKTGFLKAVARGLVFLCDMLHWVPGYRCQMAILSYRIDARYRLGVWKDGEWKE